MNFEARRQYKDLSANGGDYLLRYWFTKPINAIFFVLSLGIIFYVFFLRGMFHDGTRMHSAMYWLWSSWNPHTDYEHGKMIPFAIAILLFMTWQKAKSLRVGGASVLAFLCVLFGVGILLLAIRTKQWRFAVIAFPFVLYGYAWFLWGWRAARPFLFSCFVIYFGIRMPNIEQATNQLQVFSSGIASVVCSTLGVELVNHGNQIRSASDAWGFDIDEGCSGIRSLMALSFIAAIYAHLAHKKLWQKFLLLLSSVPIAVVANAFRVGSIVLVAEYIDEKIAAQTYHDWSGLLLFFPFGLLLLTIISRILNHGLRALKPKKRRVRLEKGKISQKPIS